MNTNAVQNETSSSQGSVADLLRISLLTTANCGGPFERIARWLEKGFKEIGVPFESAFVDSPRDSRTGAEIGLGASRAALSVPGLVRYFRRRRPSLVLVAPSYLAPFAIVAGRLTHTNVIPWEGSFYELEQTATSMKWAFAGPLRSKLYPLAPGIAAASLAVRDHIEETGLSRRDLDLIPHAVDAEEIRRMGSPPVRGERKRFCVVSSLVEHKGLKHVLQAFAAAKLRGLPGWELVVIGDGPDRGRFENMTIELGIVDEVSFLGQVANPYPLIAGSDVFVHPSLSEGFGVAVAEALALGRPAIVTASGGPQEIAGNGSHALVVPPGDILALSEAMYDLGNDEVARIRLAMAASAAMEPLRPKVVARQVVDLARRMQHN